VNWWIRVTVSNVAYSSVWTGGFEWPCL